MYNDFIQRLISKWIGLNVYPSKCENNLLKEMEYD